MECGSEQISSKKNSAKSGQSASQCCRFILSQPSSRQHLVEPGRRRGRGRERRRRRRGYGATATTPCTRSGFSAASSSVPGRVADAHQHGPIDAELVEHRDSVADDLLVVVRPGLGRPVGATVAARVDRDHPAVPGQVGHLRLPRPAVHDRVDRDEERPPLSPVAERLVADLHAVALDVPLHVRLPSPHVPPSLVDAPSHPAGLQPLQRSCKGVVQRVPGPASTRMPRRGRPSRPPRSADRQHRRSTWTR